MKTVEIEFVNLPENKKYIELVKKTIKECKAAEELSSNIYVNVILTDNLGIKKINRKYRKINKETDVLSFPMFEKNDLKKIQNEEIEYVLGDIIISVPKVEEQAVLYEHNFKREFCYMLVHGFYHLMGYDHMTEKEKKQMRKKEEEVLDRL